MDFQEILNHADYNATEVKYQGAVKRYSSVLPPPKKVPKSNVQSENIRKFLEKKKAEEAAKAAEARKEKEKLLALRAQNSKNNKKAKIMASRTKDNDFSKIKLTDDEVEAKKRREEALLRKNLADKVERMKARIEMEEKEMLLPRKRKRKSKNAEPVDGLDDHGDHDEPQNGYGDSHSNIKSTDNDRTPKNKIIKPKPPPPALNYLDLLKIAEKRQVEPVAIVVPKKEEQKLMTKKERKLMEEEIARQKRKQERLLQAQNKSKFSNSAPSATLNKKSIADKGDNKKPVVIHVGKDASKSEQDVKFKITKGTVNVPTNKNILIKHRDINPNINSKSSNSSSLEKPLKKFPTNEQKKIKSKDENVSSFKNGDMKSKVAVPKKNGLKINSSQVTLPKQADPGPKLDEEALKAKIEQEVRAKMEKEMEEKMAKEIEEKIAAKFAEFQYNQAKVIEKVPDPPKQVKKEPTIMNNSSKKAVEKSSTGIYKKDMEKMIEMRKQAMAKLNPKLKQPEKKPFHKNPYLEPPRRLLEPRRPPRPPTKGRLESDDDDDDDDDMSDFIDDGPSQNEEDYSKYIKEIFGYDRNRYADDDDDDEVMESSFAQQMKEEVRSARLGYLEDLEEEKKLLEMERKKKKKLKK